MEGRRGYTDKVGKRKPETSETKRRRLKQNWATIKEENGKAGDTAGDKVRRTKWETKRETSWET